MMSPFHLFNFNNMSILICLLMSLLLNINKSLVYFKKMFFMKYFLNTMVVMMMTFNLLGMLPYNLTLSLYIWVSFLVSLLLWLTYSFSFFMTNFNLSMSHLLPLGSPIFLWNFLIFLEALSQCIRPLTLSLRMSCNLMAGHVLMSLVMNLNNILVYSLLMILVMFESMVSIIQAFVYNILMMIYKKESN